MKRRQFGLVPMGSILVLTMGSRIAVSQGVPFGTEFQINTYTTNPQSLSSVASGAAGDFVVVWRSVSQDGDTHGVFGQRYASSGAPAGAEFLVNTYTSFAQSNPKVAAGSAGNFVVTWHSNSEDGSGYGIFAQRFAGSGAPQGGEFRANTYTTGPQTFPAITVSPAGDFVIVWSSLAQDGDSYGVFGQRYASSGAALGGEFQVNTYTTNSQARPAVAADGAGNFVVVWQSAVQDAGTSGIYAQRYASAGSPLGAEFQVNTYTTGSQSNASVAADALGNFVVTWVSNPQDGNNNGVFAQRYGSSGSPLGPEFQVNTYTTNIQGLPAVAMDAAGHFILVWEDFTQDGSSVGVFAQAYGASGAPHLAEFQVNTYTTSVQRFPAVASDASGNFVVVWSSYAQDGANYGIFGQRFGVIAPIELIRFTAE